MEIADKARFPNWEGQEVWILGGGPSLSRQFLVPQEIITKIEQGKLPVSVLSPYFKAIHDKKVIAVNMAFRLGDWIDMVFWGDSGFLKKENVVRDFENFGGLKVTSHTAYNNPKSKEQGIYCLPRDNKRKRGLHPDPAYTCWNNNSGANAIDIAVHAGAKRIILVGFDMKSSDTHSHFHNYYQKKKTPPYKTHLSGFPQIAKDLEGTGIEVINACPDSAIAQFKKCAVSDLVDLQTPKRIDVNIEKAQGTLDKYKTLGAIHRKLRPEFYLEIGVHRGNSLKLSTAEKTIGIDPKPTTASPRLQANIYKETSQYFFDSHPPDTKIDLAFIDGQHLIENALYDFIQVEKYCSPDGAIVIDDVAPAHPVQGHRVRCSVKWAGDIWKLHQILQKYRPDLDIKLLDVNPTGMLYITNLDPSNRVLETRYDQLVYEWKTISMPEQVMKRQGAYKDLSFISMPAVKVKSANKYRIGVITPTCSPERKPFLEFLEKRVYGQSYKVDKWYILDYPNKSGKPDLAKRYKQGIRRAVEDQCDLILFMEDDDYYPYTYVEEMVKAWEEQGFPAIIGVRDTHYYHLKYDTFKAFSQPARSSAFQTAITPAAKYDVCPDFLIDYDIRIWKANRDQGALVDIKHRPIGIKHGLGLTGGRYHDKSRYDIEKQKKDLSTLVDNEALQLYNRIKNEL